MISVCMATFNGEKYIYEQLESILSQLKAEDEVIISDDSSTDKTIKIIEGFHDSRIILLKQKTFHSHVYNFENALKYAKGDIIFLADQDDIWNDNKVDIMSKQLKNYDLVLSDAIIVSDKKEIIHPSWFLFKGTRRGFIRNLYKNTYLGCCMAFNRKLLNQALPFPSNINMHDWWIALNAELNGSVAFIDEPLIQYRRHGNTITPLDKKSNNTFLQKISFRIAMIQGLLVHYFNGKQK